MIVMPIRLPPAGTHIPSPGGRLAPQLEAVYRHACDQLQVDPENKPTERELLQLAGELTPDREWRTWRSPIGHNCRAPMFKVAREVEALTALSLSELGLAFAVATDAAERRRIAREQVKAFRQVQAAMLVGELELERIFTGIQQRARASQPRGDAQQDAAILAAFRAVKRQHPEKSDRWCAKKTALRLAEAGISVSAKTIQNKISGVG